MSLYWPACPTQAEIFHLSASTSVLTDDLVQEAEKGRQPYLRANACYLEVLPPTIGRLHHLQYLDLDNNCLTSLPDEIGTLANLLTLSVRDNYLATLPETIGNLVNLQFFDLGRNELTHLPTTFGNLVQVRWLHLGENRLTDIPDFSRLTELQTLFLFDNALRQIEPSICRLPQLQHLDVSWNCLQTVPEEAYRLKNLILTGNMELSDSEHEEY